MFGDRGYSSRLIVSVHQIALSCAHCNISYWKIGNVVILLRYNFKMYLNLIIWYQLQRQLKCFSRFKIFQQCHYKLNSILWVALEVDDKSEQLYISTKMLMDCNLFTDCWITICEVTDTDVSYLEQLTQSKQGSEHMLYYYEVYFLLTLYEGPPNSYL